MGYWGEEIGRSRSSGSIAKPAYVIFGSSDDEPPLWIVGLGGRVCDFAGVIVLTAIDKLAAGADNANNTAILQALGLAAANSLNQTGQQVVHRNFNI